MAIGLLITEGSIAFHGFSHFTQFHLLTPISIVFVTLMAGMWYGIATFAFSTSLGFLLLSLPRNLSESYGVTVPYAEYALHFTLYMLLAEGLVAFVLVLFYRLLGKS